QERGLGDRPRPGGRRRRRAGDRRRNAGASGSSGRLLHREIPPSSPGRRASRRGRLARARVPERRFRLNTPVSGCPSAASAMTWRRLGPSLGVTEQTQRSAKVAVDGKGRLPKAVKYIVGNEACERFSFYGMSTILVPYMQHFLGWQHNRAEGAFHDFVAGAYAATVIGGWVSGRFLWRCKSIVLVS